MKSVDGNFVESIAQVAFYLIHQCCKHNIYIAYFLPCMWHHFESTIMLITSG